MIEICFEGRPVPAHPDESIAAALTRAGIRDLRLTRGGAARGVFCGMGVCQDCLVTVDGIPNRRACMTKVSGPVTVLRQTALAALPTTALPPRPTQTLAPDVLVIGAGAAGLNAALAARQRGADVLLVDERPTDGGQYFKQSAHAGTPPIDAQAAEGQRLVRDCTQTGVTWWRGADVWGAFDPCDFMVRHDGQSHHVQPRKVILATGAYERPIAVPGWTLPGVMTVGAAQTLLRSYGVVAGKRILLAGHGPLTLQVACELSAAGALVVAVAELSGRPGLTALPALARMALNGPRLLARGYGLLRRLNAQRVPILYGHSLRAVRADGAALLAEVGPRDAKKTADNLTFGVDVVCIGYGFLPANDLARAVGCTYRRDATGMPRAERDGDGRSTVANVFIAGDSAGMGGAPAAAAEGRLAGLAAAADLGLGDDTLPVTIARRALRRHRRFQRALWSVFSAVPPETDSASDTIICRCEELTMADITPLLGGEAASLNAIKRINRLGMGRCQGRYCAAILATRLGSGGQDWSPRPPTRPTCIGDIV